MCGLEDRGDLFVRVDKGGWMHEEPDRPTLVKLVSLYGKPPWTLRLPGGEIIPDEALCLIDTVEWRGIMFDRREG